MVSPGVPGPWHRQKEIPVHGFISHLPLNLKRPFPFEEHSGNCYSSSTPRYSKKFLTKSREPTQPTPRKHSDMSHTSLSINNPPIKRDSHCYSLEHVDLPRSYDFIDSTVMKRSSSSNSYSSHKMIHQSGLDNMYAPPMTTTADTYGELVSYANWTKTQSFTSDTESPSVSSSFDFTDCTRDEPAFNNLSFTAAGSIADMPLPFQGINMQFGDSDSHIPSSQWIPWTSEPELSNQPYLPTDLASWTPSLEVQPHWSGPEYINATSTTIGTNPGFLENAPPTPQEDHVLPPSHSISTPTSIPQYQYQPRPQVPIFPQPQTHPSQIPPSPTPSEDINSALHQTDLRNALLITWKRRGFSYKDIKRIGGFKEAESTLRGRFRTLTKAKEQRVRKPKWLERDVSSQPLLKLLQIETRLIRSI